MVKTVVLISLILVAFQAFSKEFIIGLNERDIYRYKNEEGEWAGKDIQLIKAVCACVCAGRCRRRVARRG